MSDFDPRLSPTRHAPAVLGCAAVLLAAVSGVGFTQFLASPLAAPPPLDGEAAPASRPDAAAALQALATPRASTPPPLRLAAPVAVRSETFVASGAMRGSLYDSALRAGATPGLVAEAAKLFAKSLDLSRDLEPGDPFRLVFDRTATADGRTVAAGELLYAEIGAQGRTTRFYRFEHAGRVEFADEVGQALRPLLLKAPLDGARLTSAFGMRLHPLLGFNRIHPGVDFGAASGTPVFAAGDGVVEEAQWKGGYGRWLKLQHGQGFETGYGHLARFAPGLRPGVRVRQGQVVAFVGSTGLSTGPHLHYEVRRGGRQLNPQGVRSAPAAPDLAAAEAFRLQKARVDVLLRRRDASFRMAATGAGPLLR